MQTKSFYNRVPAVVLLALIVFTLGSMAPTGISAKSDDHRYRFYGWIEKMPEDLQGTWVIDGRTLTSDAQTEYDQEDGPLAVGGCAKVDIRNGRLHEIDSEPPSDCR